jgi:hypothetical protein
MARHHPPAPILLDPHIGHKPLAVPLPAIEGGRADRRLSENYFMVELERIYGVEQA